MTNLREHDDGLAGEWKCRRDSYLQAHKPVRLALVLSVVVLLASLFVPLGSLLGKIALWLFVFAVLVAIDFSMVHRKLQCPNCGKVPFLSGAGLVGNSNPERCFHCGKELRG